MVSQASPITRVYWPDVSKQVAALNPELARVIDALDLTKDYPLIKVRYPFGANVVRTGQFMLPDETGGQVPLSAMEDSQLRDELGYTQGGLPVGMVTEHGFEESMMNTQGHTLPLATVGPGSVFALWRQLDPTPSFHPIKMFNITAGARFLFLLPHIGDAAFHRFLRRDFNIRHAPPRNLLEHWEIFKALAHHPQAGCEWNTEVLFFTKNWFEKLKTDSAWRDLYLQFLQMTWQRSGYERNKMFFDLAFSWAQENRNLRPNPYLADTAKHIMMVVAGVASGFAPATDDSFAPVSFLQKIYVDHYGMNKYAPTMMQPTDASVLESGRSLYYSLQLPTTLEFSPKSRKLSSVVGDMSELKHILDVFQDEACSGRIRIEDTLVGELFERVQFDYFHNKPDRNNEISLTTDMAKDDPALTQCFEQYDTKQFACHSPFLRGCVRMKYRN